MIENWDDDKAIKVWEFSDAPEELQSISENGGHEDWLVEIPDSLLDKYGIPFWITTMDSRREPDIYNHPIKPGFKVIIASHA